MGIVDDHAEVLAGLVADHRCMDTCRVSLDGNSFGGHLALRRLIEAPVVFRAAAANVPEVDLFDSSH